VPANCGSSPPHTWHSPAAEARFIAWGRVRPPQEVNDHAHSVLTGLLDRSAVYGVLAEIEALGLDLHEVRQLTPERKSPEPGDSRSQ
jgi:hypothetical protein